MTKMSRGKGAHAGKGKSGALHGTTTSKHGFGGRVSGVRAGGPDVGNMDVRQLSQAQEMQNKGWAMERKERAVPQEVGWPTYGISATIRVGLMRKLKRLSKAVGLDGAAQFEATYKPWYHTLPKNMQDYCLEMAGILAGLEPMEVPDDAQTAHIMSNIITMRTRADLVEYLDTLPRPIATWVWYNGMGDKGSKFFGGPEGGAGEDEGLELLIDREREKHGIPSAPLPTVAQAKRLPPSWRTTISEALESKYKLAYWCSLPQGKDTFDLLTDSIGPGASRQGKSEYRSATARAAFLDTCLHGPLFLVTEATTDALVKAASILDDWSPMPELIANEHGMYILFERGISIDVPLVGRYSGAIGDKAATKTMELRGLVVSNLYFGSYKTGPVDLFQTDTDEVVFHPRKFSRRVQQYTHRIHISALHGVPGLGFAVPAELEGWNMGLSMKAHRAQLNGTTPDGTETWHDYNDFENALLGAFLLWVKQRQVIYTTRHADRGTRRRMESSAHKPQHEQEAEINLVELRARDYISREPKDGEESSIEYSCRWLVRAHWHKYHCGPGRTVIQSKYVESYIKGPDDKPLKAPKPIVYAVTR